MKRGWSNNRPAEGALVEGDLGRDVGLETAAVHSGGGGKENLSYWPHVSACDRVPVRDHGSQGLREVHEFVVDN